MKKKAYLDFSKYTYLNYRKKFTIYCDWYRKGNLFVVYNPAIGIISGTGTSLRRAQKYARRNAAYYFNVKQRKVKIKLNKRKYNNQKGF